MFITASVENVDENSAREEEINPVSAQFQLFKMTKSQMKIQNVKQHKQKGKRKGITSGRKEALLTVKRWRYFVSMIPVRMRIFIFINTGHLRSNEVLRGIRDYLLTHDQKKLNFSFDVSLDQLKAFFSIKQSCEVQKSENVLEILILLMARMRPFKML